MFSRPRLLLLGRTGQVGFELERTLGSSSRVTAVERARADQARPDTLRERVGEVRPAVIVISAVYTAVDRAEREETLPARINGEAPGILAELALRLDARLMHYSTDHVFDGTKAGAYLESDTCAPLDAYCRSKVTGEHAVQASRATHLIFRTSWIHGARGSIF